MKTDGRTRWMVGLRNGLLGLAMLTLSPCLLAQEEVPSAVGPVMKLFKSGRLPAERQGTVVEMICDRGNEHDLRVVFDQVLRADGFQDDLRMKAIDWLTKAANNRKVKPVGDLTPIRSLIDSFDKPSLQIAALRLASAWKLEAVAPSLQAIALRKEVSSDLLDAALQGLESLGGESSKSTLFKLTGKELPLGTRMRAVAGLVGLDLDAACKQAGVVLSDSRANDNPNAMLNAFFERKGGTEKLAIALKEQKLPLDVAKKALRYMYSVGRSDAELSAVLSEAAGVATDPAPPTQEEVAKLAEEVMAKGDASRGEQIFRRTELSCFRCHALNRGGGQIGPDLSAVGVSSPIDYIVNSIMNPNLAVKEQYVTKVFVLDSGSILTGVVLDRDDNRVVIRDAQGKSVTIPTADIEDEAEGKSLMPQGLTKFLTKEEVLDLAKFVSELGKPGPYAIRTKPCIQRWKVLSNPPKELAQDVPHLEQIREFILGSQPSQWASAYSMVSGRLPLDELASVAVAKTLFLQGELQVNEGGKVRIEFSTNAKFQAWMDDQPLASNNALDVALEPGRHRLTLRVELQDLAKPEVMVEFSKPADSMIQLEVIGGD